MNFEYLIKVQKQESINIEDIGNCAIDAYNDLGFNYVLIVRTKEGTTEIIEYGPIIPDVEFLPANVHYTYSRFDFKQSKIERLIQSFLNDGYKGITQAFEIELKEAGSKMRNLVDFLCL